MNKSKELVEQIDKALVALSRATGEAHISAFIVDNSVCITGLDDVKNPKTHYYRGVHER